MSGSMMSMQGMGSNGTGMAPGAQGLPPGLIQMLMQMQAQQGGGGSPLAGGGGGQTPISMMGPAMQQHPAAMGPQLPQAPGQPQQAPGGMQGAAPNLQSLLTALKAGQSGIPGSGTPAGGTPIPGMPQTGGAGSMMPAWLQALMHSGSYGATGMGMSPAVGPGGMLGGGV